MPEKTYRMMPVSVEYICDECHNGTMVPTGIALMSSPPQYPHVCNSCSAKQTFRKKYPYVSYERVES